MLIVVCSVSFGACLVFVVCRRWLFVVGAFSFVVVRRVLLFVVVCCRLLLFVVVCVRLLLFVGVCWCLLVFVVVAC